ncbi:RidA family protein [Streptomyces sp. NRRL F-5126]|uniref:RidA family protein n=1 Tax=Streptomyces sp. NRRL F-5126 TaxID=1463857 RepID=UPI0004C52B56|nr:RidA family protein [Streptomyces sp. NRRL F-5126]
MAERAIVSGLFPPPGYAHTAVVGSGRRLVFLAGAVPLDTDGALVGKDDFEAQTRQVLANLEAALAAEGCALADVVATHVYVVSGHTQDLTRVWEVVRASGLTLGPHTSTLLGVGCLGYPGQLVEITAVAEAPEEPGPGAA